MAAGVDHQSEIEQDAGAARECEQRKDKADERRVHAEGRGNAATYPGEDAIVLTAFEPQRRYLDHPASLVTRTCPAPTEASITSGA